MAKILKNTTANTVTLEKLGVTIAGNSSYTVTAQEYLILGAPETVTELTTLINNNTIRVNDGSMDITNLVDAINFLKYPDDARNIDFDNSTNGFSSRTVQKAIEEAKNTQTYYQVSNTTTTSTSSGTFSQLTGMILTPPAGTYIAVFNGRALTTGASAGGSFGIFYNGLLVADSLRDLSCNIVLLGLLTVSVNTVGSSMTCLAIIVADGTKAIQAGFRSNTGGTIQCVEKNLTLIRVL